MSLIESKSLLAKLMATENLVVEQRNVTTAMFDVKNRILTVPVLDENISSHTYDLFMGHEVGHALYTPLDGLYRAKEEKLPQSVTNVVEDSRIERKIKYKYPGLRISFNRAYKELVEKDFFGTNGVDLNSLNFVDRVNMYCKGGATTGIKFSAEEKFLLNLVETTETYDDVLDVARRIVDFMKLQEEERKRQKAESGEEDDDTESYDDDGENQDDFEDDWEESDNEKEGNNSSQNDPESQDESDEDVEVTDGRDDYSYKEVEGDNVRAYTDEAYRQNEKKLFAENAKNYVYANIPKIDLKEVIVGHKVFYKNYKEYQRNLGVDTEGFLKLRKETNKVVGYLVKEFELRKNAEQLKRASTAKTGDLDMKKIFSYKFNDDIFKKISVVPNGKSHGLVMFLDWSGSMSHHLDNTIKQLISLVMFCKKVNIPYDVYSFATQESFYGGRGQFEAVRKVGDLYVHNIQLFNILSSKMSASEFTYAGSALTYLARRPRYCPNWMALGGTPLNEAIICAMEIIPQFQKQYKLQIVNTVFLTDGEGHSLRAINKERSDGRIYPDSYEFGYGSNRNNSGLVIRDPVTKNQEKIDNIYSGSAQTGAFVKLLKARTNCNVLGFYIITGREFNKKIWDFYPKISGETYDAIKSNFRKSKYAVVTSAGFDEYYVLRSESLGTEDSEFVVKENATTRGLVSAFSKYAGGRIANRVVLNRFIGLIS